jgi:hypothetical protein
MIQEMDEYFPVQYMVLLLFVYIFLWSKYGKCLYIKALLWGIMLLQHQKFYPIKVVSKTLLSIPIRFAIRWICGFPVSLWVQAIH